MTDQNRFINGLKILHSMDRHEIDATLGRPIATAEWVLFSHNPYRFLMRADGETADAIWRAIEARQPTPSNNQESACA